MLWWHFFAVHVLFSEFVACLCLCMSFLKLQWVDPSGPPYPGGWLTAIGMNPPLLHCFLQHGAAVWCWALAFKPSVNLPAASDIFDTHRFGVFVLVGQMRGVSHVTAAPHLRERVGLVWSCLSKPQETRWGHRTDYVQSACSNIISLTKSRELNSSWRLI